MGNEILRPRLRNVSPADGLLHIAANEVAQYEKLSIFLGRPRLKTDPVFLRPGLRREIAPASIVKWNKRLYPWGPEWEALMKRQRPAGRVLSVPEFWDIPTCKNELRHDFRTPMARRTLRGEDFNSWTIRSAGESSAKLFSGTDRLAARVKGTARRENRRASIEGRNFEVGLGSTKRIRKKRNSGRERLQSVEGLR